MLYPDVDGMYEDAGFVWDAEANAWRFTGQDRHMPGTTTFLYIRPVYTTASMTGFIHQVDLSLMGATAKVQLDRFFTKGLTEAKLKELEKVVYETFGQPWLPLQGESRIMAAVRRLLGVEG